jgi:SAM-dependent methyltransferase
VGSTIVLARLLPSGLAKDLATVRPACVTTVRRLRTDPPAGTVERRSVVRARRPISAETAAMGADGGHWRGTLDGSDRMVGKIDRVRDFDPRLSFGPTTAARYDDHPRGDEAAAVDFLAEVAGDGRALELAIGTGRVARPLSERGVPVDGIELSPAMVDQLRRRPGGEQLRVEIGDMIAVDMGERYTLVFLVYNTIFNLLTADDQVRCFENAARHLEAEGAFVVETALPHAWIPPGQPDYVRTEVVELDEVGFDVARYDPATQLLTENHVRIDAEGIRFAPIVCRLITPGEMDLMARLAGLTLDERFGSWRREPFGSASLAHVSVYRSRSPLDPCPCSLGQTRDSRR